MARPKKTFKSNTVKTLDEFDNVVEVSKKETLDCDAYHIIHPQQWDIEEEFNPSICEALRDIQREKMDQF